MAFDKMPIVPAEQRAVLGRPKIFSERDVPRKIPRKKKSKGREKSTLEERKIKTGSKIVHRQ